ARQRLARSRLALAMGRPGELVSELEMPEITIPAADEEGDFEAYWRRVEAGHPRLQALRERLAAARKEVEAARNSEGPVLRAGLEASVYNRSAGSTHPIGGGLELSVPLYTGGRREAAIAHAEAEATQAQADLQEALSRLRQEALELWVQGETLRTDYQGLRVEGDYRELYLDRSRALYDLEVKTDLGDAMTRISEVRLATARTLFAWALNRARMKAMTGELLEKTP
ncbi:MAG: TolC family protein, partial [Gammaproteobacteria bacterium]